MAELFLLWRLVDFIISFAAQQIVPSTHNYIFYLGHKENVLHIPHFIFPFANFDGANYLQVSQQGYGLYQQTYFPLFPLLIHFVSFIIPGNYYLSHFVAGFLIGNISFLIGLYYFHEYLKLAGLQKQQRRWTIFFLLTFPSSFFFGAVYTEGLFFLLIVACLYYLQKKQYIQVLIFSFFAALTRLLGVFLIIPMIFHFFIPLIIKAAKKGQDTRLLSRINHFMHHFPQKAKYLVIIASPLAGLLSYMIYLQQTTHDPLAFYHGQSGFNNGRTTHLILLPQVYFRYIKIFLYASHSFMYFVACLEFIIFNLIFAVLIYDLYRLWKKEKTNTGMSLVGLNLVSLVNILLPTLTGTFSSIPRYALFSLSFFIRLGTIQNKFLRYGLLLLFTIWHVILLSYFIQGYFIG